MLKRSLLLVLCAAAGGTGAHAETFVIRGDAAGHDAMLKIPVGAITELSADFAESLAGAADAQVEAIHLKGDVSISIAGSVQPIHIKADNVVLELTPDSVQRVPSKRSDAAANKLLRSTVTLPGADDSQVFTGNVVFDLQTATGPMQIKADRVEHQLQPEEKPVNAGA